MPLAVFKTNFTDDDSFRLGFADDLEADLSSSLAVQIFTPADPYAGPYEVTPSAATQVLETANLSMTENVVINPIPSNYGLITWNGSVITVS